MAPATTTTFDAVLKDTYPPRRKRFASRGFSSLVRRARKANRAAEITLARSRRPKK